MEWSLSLVKLIIKLIISLILLVMLFIIAAFLYSAKYWPDVYNYINANITIEAIPKLSELNITVYEVEYTTEYINTTENYEYTDMTTVEADFDDNDYTHFFEDLDGKRAKRNVVIESDRDYSELPSKNVIVDYFFEETSTKIFNDLIDERKLTTRDLKFVEFFAVDEVKFGKCENNLSCNCGLNDGDVSVIYPWIAAIFIKNSNNDQFDYYCDGALLSHNIIITAARCVLSPDAPVNSDNVVAIVGKRSLQSTGGNEHAVRIQRIILHENFTMSGEVENDLAILVLEETTNFNSDVRPACLNDEEDFQKAATTSWKITGQLKPIYFDKTKSKSCKRNTKSDSAFCATYGNDVDFCPSYGGLYAVKQTNNLWYLRGIRTGDPTERGICFDRDITYTNLSVYSDWIRTNIDDNKK